MKHYTNNPRKISKKELRQLRTDLEELGDLGGFVHNLATDEIVGGNQRSEAIPGILAGKLQPVITQRYDPPNAQGTVAVGFIEWQGEQFKYRAVRWDEATARRANIRANKAGGDWDWDALSSWEASELMQWGFDGETLKDWGNNVSALGALLGSEAVEESKDAEPQIDKAAELQEVWKVQNGELFHIGAHRLICGDCTDRATVERLMGGEKAEMCFTSPPYNAGVSAQLSGNTSIDDNLYKDEYDDDKTDTDYLNLLSSFTSEALRVSVYTFVNIQVLSGNKRAFVDYWHKFNSQFCDIAIWDKQHAAPQMARRVMDNRFEFVLIFGGNGSRSIGTRDFCKGVQNVYTGSPQRDNEYSSSHAATFPVDFPSYFISTFTNEGEKVYEPFAGTGTTGIACQNLGRQARMVEISPAYCAIILERFTQAFPGIEITRYPPE